MDFDALGCSRRAVTDSLDLDLPARCFDLSLDLGGLVFRDAFLDRLRRALDQVLGLFETEPGDGANFLDDLDLLVAGRCEDDVELRLHLGRRGSGSGTGGTGDGTLCRRDSGTH